MQSGPTSRRRRSSAWARRGRWPTSSHSSFPTSRPTAPAGVTSWTVAGPLNDAPVVKLSIVDLSRVQPDAGSTEACADSVEHHGRSTGAAGSNAEVFQVL